MSKFRISIQGNDILGIDFIRKVIKYANLGAVEDTQQVIRMTFPHRAVLVLQADKSPAEEAGVSVVEIDKIYTRDELEAMEWTKLRKVCKEQGITGRDRNVMIEKYLEGQ